MLMKVPKTLYNVRLEEVNGGFQAAGRKQSTDFPEVLSTCTDFGWSHMWLEGLHLSRAAVSMLHEAQQTEGNSHGLA